MGRINLSNAGKYGSGGSNDFFTLVDDGDRATVTFLYDDQDGEDIDYYVIHEQEIDGKRRYVNCNAISKEDGKVHPENCPLCEEGNPRIEKLFLQLYNHDSGKVETWDRGRSYVAKIVTYINKYKYLVTQPFELIRSGRKGDSNTTYEFLAEAAEPDAVLEDFDERAELLGTLIVDATAEQMWDMLDGRFTLQDDSNSNRGSQRRGSSNNSRQTQSRQSAPSRRTEPTRKAEPTRRTATEKAEPAPGPTRRGPARGPARGRF